LDIATPKLEHPARAVEHPVRLSQRLMISVCLVLSDQQVSGASNVELGNHPAFIRVA
jgi:hypothetical protein